MENVCRSIPSAFRQRQLLARGILGQDDARRVHDLLLHEKRKAVLRFGKQRARFALHARRSRKNNHLSHRKGVQRLGYVGAQIRDARLTLFLRHLQKQGAASKNPESTFKARRLHRTAYRPGCRTKTAFGNLGGMGRTEFGIHSRTVCSTLSKNVRTEIPRVFAVHC